MSVHRLRRSPRRRATEDHRGRRGGVIGVAIVLGACAGPAATPSFVATPSATASASPSIASLEPTPTPTPTSTSTASPTPANARGWAELTDAPVPYLYGVTEDGSGYLGVGLGSDSTDTAPVSAVWRSTDGIAWEEAPYELPGANGTTGGLASVVTTATGYAAIAGAAPFDVAVSENGTEWEHQELGAEACPQALAANGDIIVAVGVAVAMCGTGGLGEPGIWTSSGDGWAALDTPPAAGWFRGVVATRRGFSAWGTITGSPDTWICQIGCQPDSQAEPFAGAPWYSEDGWTWRRAEGEEAFSGAMVEGIASSDLATVAVGWVPAPDSPEGMQAAAWRSTDGSSWSRIEGELPFAEAQQGMSLAIGGGGPALAVWTRGFGPEAAYQVWTTTDGEEWDDAVELSANVLRGVSSLGDRLIAYGEVQSAEPGVALPCTKDQVIAGRCRFGAAAWIYTP